MKLTSPYLKTLNLNPENQESPIHFLYKWRTPQEYFYIRNHFSYPLMGYVLLLDGKVKRTIHFSYWDLLKMPSKTLVIPLECSGNNRTKFKPKVFGEQWEEGAISQAKWKGVPLNYLISQAGIEKDVDEVVFSGRDLGKRPDTDTVVHFQRSLPIKKAIHPDTLIAYELNDRPLSYQHGFPFRLIVPQWYAMASVKWLQRITFIKGKFKGPFQDIDYNYYPNKGNNASKFPVTTMNVNSTILKPLDYSIHNTGVIEIKGLAWTGEGSVVQVEISVDNGTTWEKAKISKLPNEPYAWIKWSFSWEVTRKGEYKIWSRAKDTKGRSQPNEPFWNRKGYGYNAVSTVNIKIE